MARAKEKMACLFKVGVLIHYHSDIFLTPMNASMVESPDSNYNWNTANNGTGPLSSNLLVFNNILFGDFAQQIQITEWDLPKI
jgi:hypothetical protein